MADLADGERGDVDADAGSGLEDLFLGSLVGMKVIGTGDDAGRLYNVGDPDSCVARSASSEEDPSSQSTSSDVCRSELFPPSMLLLREMLSLPSMSVLS